MLSKANNGTPYDIVIFDLYLTTQVKVDDINQINNHQSLSYCKKLILTPMDNTDIESQLDTNQNQTVIHRPSSPAKIFSTLEQLERKGEPTESTIINTSSDKPNFANNNILIAEDNKVNQIVISKMLDKLSCRFHIVNDGKQALAEYKKNHAHYDILLMDCEMPTLNGYEATRLIRQWEHNNKVGKIPIIAVTAHAQQEFETKSKRAGMDDYITKPVDINSIKRGLEKWLTDKNSVY
jgi:two-component system, sensor histidine kinase and response regulator